jgi:hypothetical protein
MSAPRSTYDKPRRSDAVGLLTMLRDGEKAWTAAVQHEGDDGAHYDLWMQAHRKYRRWARWVQAVLDSGGGGE